MPSLLQDRAIHTDAGATASRPRRRGPRRLIAAGVGLAVLVPVAAHLHDRVTGLDDRLEQRVVDRSTPPLLLALDDLAEFHAATGSFQVMIDRENDTPFVPSAISGDRVSFLATGHVNAYVDFDGLESGAVTLSSDGESATIVLPAPRIGDVRIDADESGVVDRDRGVLDRVGSAFVENPSDDSELYVLAERELAAAAVHSDLLDRAERNTRNTLEALGRSLGVDEVVVEFEDPPSDGS